MKRNSPIVVVQIPTVVSWHLEPPVDPNELLAVVFAGLAMLYSYATICWSQLL